MPFDAILIERPIAPRAARGVDCNQEKVVSGRLGKYLYACPLRPPLSAFRHSLDTPAHDRRRWERSASGWAPSAPTPSCRRLPTTQSVPQYAVSLPLRSPSRPAPCPRALGLAIKRSAGHPGGYANAAASKPSASTPRGLIKSYGARARNLPVPGSACTFPSRIATCPPLTVATGQPVTCMPS